MAAKLIAEEGALKGLVLSLEEGDEWTIGRDPDMCQLVVEDPATSRRHLVCRRTDEGFILENLSHTNPIAINGEEVTEPRLLRHSDTVKLGGGVFRFYAEEAAQVHEEPQEEPTPEAGDVVAAPAAAEEPHHDTIFGEEEDAEEAPAEEETFADVSFTLQATGRWLLKVIAGPNNGAEFAMQPGRSYVIGTDADSCDIIFHDISVSRQHARITVSDDETLAIEDLQSRNHTLIDGDATEEKTQLASNNLVTMGTTTFVVIDRESEVETIVSPPLASFGKIIQDEATIHAAHAAVQKVPRETAPAPTVLEDPLHHAATLEEKTSSAVGALILLAIITGLFVIVGIGTSTLFRSEEVVTETVDVTLSLNEALQDFPHIQHSFTKSTGTLLLLGHVISAVDRSQLLYNLQGLPFIKNIDDNIVIDEFVWQEANQVLAKNPSWRSVAIHSPAPGRFVMTGYLQTKAQADLLSDYITLNFPYPELLEKHVIVEEDIITAFNTRLQENRIFDVAVTMSNGELTLSGIVGQDKAEIYQQLLREFKKEKGIQALRNFVVEVEPRETMIDISDEFEISGYSNVGGVNLNVVVNGRILAKGDTLDGMTITRITPGTVYLEKEGFKYRIDFNK